MRAVWLPLLALALAFPAALPAAHAQEEAPPADEAPADAPALDDETPADAGEAPPLDGEAPAEEGEAPPEWEGEGADATPAARPEDEAWQDDRTEAERKAKEEAEEFATAWVGARIGAWYRPAIKFSAEVSGSNGLAGLFGTSIDAEQDLGITEDPKSDYLGSIDPASALEIGLHFETRFVSLFGWWVAPLEYEGESVLTRDINFGGQTFSVSDTVESRFRQFFAGVDLELNVLNGRYLRLSPLVGGRMIGVDWEVKEALGGLGGNTNDIDTPLEWAGYQIIPLAEVGVDVRLGYRDYIDFGIKAAGAWVSYAGIEGTTVRLEATVTVYPIPYIGFELGARYLSWELESASNDPADQFQLDLRYTGAMAAVILRLG